MIEFRDGTFGGPMPVNEAIKELTEFLEQGREVRALHIGSPDELMARKQDPLAEVRRDLGELKQRVEALEPVKSDTLHIPVAEEVRRFAKP